MRYVDILSTCHAKQSCLTKSLVSVPSKKVSDIIPYPDTRESDLLYCFTFTLILSFPLPV